MKDTQDLPPFLPTSYKSLIISKKKKKLTKIKTSIHQNPQQRNEGGLTSWEKKFIRHRTSKGQHSKIKQSNRKIGKGGTQNKMPLSPSQVYRSGKVMGSGDGRIS